MQAPSEASESKREAVERARDDAAVRKLEIIGLPAVAAGVAVVHGHGLITTSYVYGAGVIALAAVAVLNQLRGRGREIAD